MYCFLQVCVPCTVASLFCSLNTLCTAPFTSFITVSSSPVSSLLGVVTLWQYLWITARSKLYSLQLDSFFHNFACVWINWKYSMFTVIVLQSSKIINSLKCEAKGTGKVGTNMTVTNYLNYGKFHLKFLVTNIACTILNTSHVCQNHVWNKRCHYKWYQWKPAKHWFNSKLWERTLLEVWIRLGGKQFD